MKVLPLTFKKYGYTYTQVLRGKRSVIYRLQDTSKIDYFDVFKINTRKAKVIFGRSIPEREVLPSDEDYGVWAWSCRLFTRAKERFDKLESGEMFHDR